MHANAASCAAANQPAAAAGFTVGTLAPFLEAGDERKD